jgi:hypothetical protein
MAVMDDGTRPVEADMNITPSIDEAGLIRGIIERGTLAFSIGIDIDEYVQHYSRSEMRIRIRSATR